MHCSPKVRSPPQRLPMGTVYLNKNSNNRKIESARGDDGKRAKAFFSIVPRAPSFSVSPGLCGGDGSRYDKTGNKYIQLVLQHDASKRVSSKQCWSFYHPCTANCLATNQVAASHQILIVWPFKWTSSAVLSHGTIYLVWNSNFWVCTWNPIWSSFKCNVLADYFLMKGLFRFSRHLTN